MVQLVLVRHAKAVQWGYEDDFHRELTPRGLDDALKVSFYLREQGVVPRLILSSPATRAMQTAGIFAGSFSYPLERIEQDHGFYLGVTTAEFLRRLQEIPEGKEVVYFFGHNPTLSFFAEQLCTSFGREMPTCSAVVIEFPVGSWAQAEVRTGKLVMQVNPKDIKH